MQLPEVPGVLTARQVDATVESIARLQQPDGSIPWFEGHHTDAWNHVEAAMALDVGGRHDEALAAYRWLCEQQLPDGCWPAYWQHGTVRDAWVDTNMCAYIAVGTWHHFLATGETKFVWQMWPHVRAAIDFVIDLQAPGGEIAWSRREDGTVDARPLLTGCSSIHQSLRAALAIAELVDEAQPDWELAVGWLRHALNCHQDRFEPKHRWSMDWYYPVLGGAVRDAAARQRITDGWSTFVVPGLGVRCVSDRPWVTGAETCELALALDAIGQRERAIAVLDSMQHLRNQDGSYWTGFVFDEGVNWPGDSSTYTAGAVVLAADALVAVNPTSGIFRADDLPRGVGPGDRCDEVCEIDLNAFEDAQRSGH